MEPWRSLLAGRSTAASASLRPRSDIVLGATQGREGQPTHTQSSPHCRLRAPGTRPAPRRCPHARSVTSGLCCTPIRSRRCEPVKQVCTTGIGIQNARWSRDHASRDLLDVEVVAACIKLLLSELPVESGAA